MRRAALIIALSAAVLQAVGAQEAAARDTGAQDAAVPAVGAPGFKYLHFLAGLSLGLSVAQLLSSALPARLPGDAPWLFPLIAVSTAATGGIGKEILDSTGFGDPRFSDIVVTTVGGIVAAGIIAYAQSQFTPTAQGRTSSAVFVLSTAGVLAVPVVIGFAREVASYVERRRRASGEAPPAGPSAEAPPAAR